MTTLKDIMRDLITVVLEKEFELQNGVSERGLSKEEIEEFLDEYVGLIKKRFIG